MSPSSILSIYHGLYLCKHRGVLIVTPVEKVLALALITLFHCFLSVLLDTARFICASLDTFKNNKHLKGCSLSTALCHVPTKKLWWYCRDFVILGVGRCQRHHHRDHLLPFPSFGGGRSSRSRFHRLEPPLCGIRRLKFCTTFFGSQKETIAVFL